MFDSVYRPTENAKIVSFHPCPEAMLHLGEKLSQK
jgi:hypothetical protein